MKIYWYEGRKNVIGKNVRALRIKAKISQRILAEKAQLLGYDLDRLTVMRIENGKRFVAEYEVKALADALKVNINLLYENNEPES